MTTLKDLELLQDQEYRNYVIDLYECFDLLYLLIYKIKIDSPFITHKDWKERPHYVKKLMRIYYNSNVCGYPRYTIPPSPLTNRDQM